MGEQITAEVGLGITEESKETITESSERMPSDSVLGSSVTTEQLHPTDADWPTCWTLDQRNEFCSKYH